jgi:hypothetical protein
MTSRSLAVGLAGSLGASPPAVQAALRDAGTRATQPDRGTLSAELARTLGRDEAEIRAAFARLRS